MTPAASSPIPDQDLAAALAERVAEAQEQGEPLRITGGNSKHFLGLPVSGTPLDVTGHCGIVHYDPVELILTARTGTPLARVEAALAEAGQFLPFEPPHFAGTATLGGCVAAGLSGPRRPWSGAVRDFVLGVRCIGHDGVIRRFGGEVMKNVAGYDVSRLMVGAFGTLGVLTEVSLKVLPRPRASATIRIPLDLPETLRRLADWGRQPLPISGAAWLAGWLHLRLEGGAGSVQGALAQLGGEEIAADFWTALREQQHAFFTAEDPRPLWRLSVPLQTPPLALDGDWWVDWAGAQRWLRSSAPAAHIRTVTGQAGGHASCFTPGAAEPFHPLQPILARYHRQLKQQFDPRGIFNPGRMYGDL